jgi:hypothetical protein
MSDQDVKVQSSFLLPLSLKRWIEDEARRLSRETGKKVSTGDVVRDLLEGIRGQREAVAA